MDAKGFKAEPMSDLIIKQDTLKRLCEKCTEGLEVSACGKWKCIEYRLIEEMPSAQPEVRPIDYQDCSNAMLKMWMDNVVTYGEYNRIMDKLNAYWGKKDE